MAACRAEPCIFFWRKLRHRFSANCSHVRRQQSVRHRATGRSSKPLKVAYSNAGPHAAWCAQGKQTAEYRGKLFNVSVTWFDGELSAVKQRSAIDNMAARAEGGHPRTREPRHRHQSRRHPRRAAARASATHRTGTRAVLRGQDHHPRSADLRPLAALITNIYAQRLRERGATA